MNDAQKALKELYALFVEYDLNTQLEDEARACDERDAHPEMVGDYPIKHEWLRVLGILEGAKVALGIDRDPMPALDTTPGLVDVEW